MVQNDKVKKIIKHRLALSIGILMATSTPVLSSSAFALEALDDQSLKDVTGEGIAFTLSDFSMQYKGADDSAGTGYTRIIPVGHSVRPLIPIIQQTLQPKSVKRMYGYMVCQFQEMTAMPQNSLVAILSI
jgi:hypothetical protein